MLGSTILASLILLGWGCGSASPPKTNDLLLQTGQQQLVKGDYTAAIQSLQNVLAQPNPSVEVYRYLGRAYLSIGAYNKAEESLKLGLERTPEDPEFYDLLGAVHMSRAFSQAQYDNTDAALVAFRTALELDPQRAPTLYHMG